MLWMIQTILKTSTTVHDLSVRLLMLIAVKNNLGLMAGDIGNAFLTAPNMEKVWTVAGPEFGGQVGSVIEITRALYGLATASRSFHKFFDFIFTEIARFTF